MSENTTTMAPASFFWMTDVRDLPEDHVFVKFYEARQAGTVWKQMPESIRAKVSYAEGSKFEQRQRAIQLGECIDLDGTLQKMTPTQFAQWVRTQRLNYKGGLDLGKKTGLSWAEIMVRCGLGEAACSKAFTSVTNVDRKGLRIGHGGRFAEDRADQYQGGAKAHGWIRPQAESIDEVLRNRLDEITGDAGITAEFMAMTVAELKAQLKELGQPTKGSKSVLARRLATALAS